MASLLIDTDPGSSALKACVIVRAVSHSDSLTDDQGHQGGRRKFLCLDWVPAWLQMRLKGSIRLYLEMLEARIVNCKDIGVMKQALMLAGVLLRHVAHFCPDPVCTPIFSRPQWQARRRPCEKWRLRFLPRSLTRRGRYGRRSARCTATCGRRP